MTDERTASMSNEPFDPGKPITSGDHVEPTTTRKD